MPTQQALQNMTRAQRERRQWERAKREREQGSGVIFWWFEQVNRRRRKRGRVFFEVVTRTSYGGVERKSSPIVRTMELRPGDEICIHLKHRLHSQEWDEMDVTIKLLSPEVA